MSRSDAINNEFDFSRLLQFTTAAPIFVVGAARSGTSAMRMALQEGAGLPGYRCEEQLLNMFPELLASLVSKWSEYEEQAEVHQRETLKKSLMRYDILQALNAVAFTFDHALSDGHSRWVSKTANPETILALPLWKHVYPSAKIVFMNRHPIKVALSRQRKFPNVPLENAFQSWLRAMEAWESVKADLCEDDYLEIRQADLGQRTEEVARALASLLQLNEAQRAGIMQYLQTNRPESTNSSPDASEICLEDVGWPQESKAMASRLCGDMAVRWGYRMSRTAPASP